MKVGWLGVAPNIMISRWLASDEFMSSFPSALLAFLNVCFIGGRFCASYVVAQMISLVACVGDCPATWKHLRPSRWFKDMQNDVTVTECQNMGLSSYLTTLCSELNALPIKFEAVGILSLYWRHLWNCNIIVKIPYAPYRIENCGLSYVQISCF